MRKVGNYPHHLADGDTVAVIGGGPAGVFSTLHRLQQARARGKCIRVVILEPSCKPSNNSTASLSGHYVGCPQCAGGISPKLYDALMNLGIELQPEVIQAGIGSISVQGKWKSITIPVPSDRKMYSVYRGTLPYGQHHGHCFDAMLLGIAESSGAELIGARLEGIIPALEPAHALAHVMKIAPALAADHLMVMNMCGRGDKDIFAVADHLGITL